MEKVDIELIRKSLRWGDVRKIAEECNVSQQKVSKILCGLVIDPDLNVLSTCLKYAERNLSIISVVNQNLNNLSKYDRTVNATAVGESSAR